MNLDELISKYLDGELNATEDALLRSKLSEDAVARLKFDSAVNIHLAYKEDAESIYPPQELIDKTEDMIMMRIFAQAPEPQKRRMLVWNAVPMMAAVIVFFMFTFVFEISVPKVDEFNGFTSDAPADIISSSRVAENKSENTLINKESRNKATAGRQTTVVNKSQYSGTALAVTNIMEPAVNANDTKLQITNELPNLSNDNISENAVTSQIPAIIENYNNQENVVATNDEIKVNNEVLSNQVDAVNRQDASFSMSLNSKENISVNEKNNSLLAQNGFSNKNNRVINIANFSNYDDHRIIQLGSVFGTDLFRSGLEAEDAPISHFSQSIAYAFDEDERFGFEFGYTQYNYSEKATINVKQNAGSGKSSGIEAFEGGFDFSFSRPTSITITNNKQLLWATAFYEYSFLQATDISLVGRLGAGGTSDGFLGYGRVFLQYEMFNVIHLTFGLDGRVFSAETSKFSEKDDKVKSTASLIYGLQFKF